MNRNCLLHEKVRHELGEGGASKDQAEMLEALSEYYESARDRLGAVGLNPEALDIELQPCEPREIIDDKEKQIEAILAVNGTYSAGKCYNKIGFTCVNGEVLRECTRRGRATEQVEVQRKAGNSKAKANIAKEKALATYTMWVQDGRKMVDNHPDIKAGLIKEIAMFLLPLIPSSTRAPSHYNTGPKVKDHFAELKQEHGICWDAEMAKFVRAEPLAL